MTGEPLPREEWKKKYEQMERNFLHMRRRCEHAELERDALKQRLSERDEELGRIKRKYGLIARQGSLPVGRVYER